MSNAQMNINRLKSSSPMSKKENNAFSGCPCSSTTLDQLVQPDILAILADSQVHGYEISDSTE